MDDLAWAPDGQRIVGVLPSPKQESVDDQLVILDVGTLISSR